MSTKIEFLPGDLAAAVFALANNRINFYVPSAYEVGMGNASRRATVSAETLAYFKDRLSFSVSRQDADRQLARLLTLASDYLAHLSAPISLWARESMNKLPQTRYKAVRRNCGLLVEILSTLAFHRRNTNLIVAQLDLTFMYREMFGLKVSRDACKTALIKLAEAELITLKLGEKNGYASKVKLLTSVDHLGNVFTMRGSEEESSFIRNAMRYADTMDALKKDQALRRKATEAAKSNHYDKMRGEELEAEFTVTAFLAAGGSLQGSNELVTREGSLVR